VTSAKGSQRAGRGAKLVVETLSVLVLALQL
jgi:hypothetical protein